MNISIVCVGKIKEKYFMEGIKEYQKRLQRYCKLDIIEVPDEKAPENLSEAEMEIVKEKEGQRILAKIKDGTYVFVLDIGGKQLSSESYAQNVDRLGISGHSNIAFVIGGSLGLSEQVLKRSDFKLSFSKMTFPHQLMRLILLEQIYRGFKIIKGEPYHK